MRDEEYQPGCFAIICSAITFFATWIFAIVIFNFFGLVLGWIPAMIVAIVIYFVAEIALVLLLLAVFLLIIMINVVAILFLL